MRNAIFITLLTLPLVSVAAHAGNAALDSRNEIFGISSEDVGGSSYLGVDTRDITPDRLGALKLKEEQKRSKGWKSPWWTRTLPLAKLALKSTMSSLR
jgi:hypothetical protein